MLLERPSYIPCLDGIRACAFLVVFIAHSDYDHIIPGGLGVTVFFFLSGYLITSLLRIEFEDSGDISLKQFYIRRAYRILPPLYITLAIAGLVHFVGVTAGHGNTLGWISALAYVFNYAELISHGRAQLPSGMGLVWSLMIEEHFYLLFPILYKTAIMRLWRRSQQSKVLLATCAAVLIWRCVLVYYFKIPLEAKLRWTYSATDTRLDSIALGCVLAIAHNPWCNDAGGWLGRHAKLLAGLGCFVLFLTLIVREPHFREAFRYSIQTAALYPIFYFCVATPQYAWVKWLSWGPLRWLGWISYTLYLCHEAILAALKYVLPPGRPLLAIVAFVLSLLYAWGMRHMVELPLRKLRSRRALRQTASV
jgi:peptidoglycan/LPS O-acetylase OafA/YrhL